MSSRTCILSIARREWQATLLHLIYFPLNKFYLAYFLDYGFHHRACPLAFRIWFSHSPSKVGCLLSCQWNCSPDDTFMSVGDGHMESAPCTAYLLFC